MLTGVALSPLSSCNTPKKESTKAAVNKNWAGNITYSTNNIHEPATTDEVREIIMRSEKLRALGTRHCFNTIADSTENLLSTSKLTEIGPIDPGTGTITVGGGIRYGDLCKVLYEKGFALHNLASLPHISVAGACATATHGSGVTNGNLSTAVSEVEMMTGTGDLVTFSREKTPAEFPGVVVNLGAFGVVTRIKLQLLPAFRMRQRVYLNLPMSELVSNFETIMGAGYSVSLFTDWQTDNINQVWIKNLAKDAAASEPTPTLHGAVAADRGVHPIISVSAENCTPQMDVVGPWYERLPHFKMDFTPSNGEELQAEYFVPRSKAVEAILAVAANHKEALGKLLFISEIRTIAADDLWLSTAYGQDSVAIHFTLKPDTPGVMQFLPKLEQTLSPFNARPHWGKLFAMAPGELRARYDKFDQFRLLVEKYDPAGKFRNDFLERLFSGQ